MSADKGYFSPFLFLAPLLALTFVVLPGSEARASAINQCIDSCFGSNTCAYNESQGQSYTICQSGRDLCVEQCNRNINGHEEPPPVTGAYGAIAYDKASGAWGMADRSQGRKAAETSAISHCEKHGHGCEIVESFSKSCAAVAAGTGDRFAWAVADNPKQAGLDAIKKCGESGSSGNSNDHSRCFMQLYNCYYP